MVRSGNVIFSRKAALVFPPVDRAGLAAAEFQPYSCASPVLLVNEHRAKFFQCAVDFSKVLLRIVRKYAARFQTMKGGRLHLGSSRESCLANSSQGSCRHDLSA